MNKVILMGRLTRDPEVRYAQGDNPLAIARYTLAVDRTNEKVAYLYNPMHPAVVELMAMAARAALNVKGLTLSDPSDCATNALPHASAARSRITLPGIANFFFGIVFLPLEFHFLPHYRPRMRFVKLKENR